MTMNGIAMSYVGGVVSAQPELLDAFIAAACGGTGGSSKATLRGIADVYLEPVHMEALVQENGAARLGEADFCLLLVQFLDVMTLDRIRELVRSLPSQATHAMHVLICRKAGDTDYKISCTKCGQKLLVRDAMAMRRVRCPHCQDFFQVPGQVDLIRAELLLPANRLVRKVILGDAESCRQALESVIGHYRERATAAKNTTMRLDLPTDT